MKIKGISLKTGNFQDPKTNQNIAFSNYYLQFEETNAQHQWGNVTVSSYNDHGRKKEYKIKQQVLDKYLSDHHATVINLIGKDVELAFDQYSNIIGFISVN